MSTGMSVSEDPSISQIGIQLHTSQMNIVDPSSAGVSGNNNHRHINNRDSTTSVSKPSQHTTQAHQDDSFISSFSDSNIPTPQPVLPISASISSSRAHHHRPDSPDDSALSGRAMGVGRVSSASSTQASAHDKRRVSGATETNSSPFSEYFIAPTVTDRSEAEPVRDTDLSRFRQAEVDVEVKKLRKGRVPLQNKPGYQRSRARSRIRTSDASADPPAERAETPEDQGRRGSGELGPEDHQELREFVGAGAVNAFLRDMRGGRVRSSHARSRPTGSRAQGQSQAHDQYPSQAWDISRDHTTADPNNQDRIDPALDASLRLNLRKGQGRRAGVSTASNVRAQSARPYISRTRDRTSSRLARLPKLTLRLAQAQVTQRVMKPPSQQSAAEGGGIGEMREEERKRLELAYWHLQQQAAPTSIGVSMFKADPQPQATHGSRPHTSGTRGDGVGVSYPSHMPQTVRFQNNNNNNPGPLSEDNENIQFLLTSRSRVRPSRPQTGGSVSSQGSRGGDWGRSGSRLGGWVEADQAAHVLDKLSHGHVSQASKPPPTTKLRTGHVSIARSIPKPASASAAEALLLASSPIPLGTAGLQLPVPGQGNLDLQMVEGILEGDGDSEMNQQDQNHSHSHKSLGGSASQAGSLKPTRPTSAATSRPNSSRGSRPQSGRAQLVLQLGRNSSGTLSRPQSARDVNNGKLTRTPREPSPAVTPPLIPPPLMLATQNSKENIKSTVTGAVTQCADNSTQHVNLKAQASKKGGKNGHGKRIKDTRPVVPSFIKKSLVAYHAKSHK